MILRITPTPAPILRFPGAPAASPVPAAKPVLLRFTNQGSPGNAGRDGVDADVITADLVALYILSKS